MAPSNATPNWQPLSFLPKIAWMIDGMAESAEEQQANLNMVGPGSLDDATLGRVTSVYTEQRDDLWMYAEQLARWRVQPCTEAQRTEIARLEQRLEKLREMILALLAHAEQLKPQTIDAILAKSDIELAMDVLSGKLPLPGRPTTAQAKTPRGKQK